MLTILEIGLGHIYTGNFKKGLCLFLIGQFLSLAFMASPVLIKTGALSLIIGIAASIAFTVYCVVGAVLIAGGKKEACKPAKYNSLLGKALIIYWSLETSRDEYLHTSPSERLGQSTDIVLNFFAGTRWRRTFKAIE